MTVQLPPTIDVAYNKTKYGYFGELGTGANAHVRFLQTALSVDELDSVTLIENIPGSETWDVRDLFQRDVDKERVTQEILPYLKDKNRVKFFNPLTLALLPMATNGQTIEGSLPHIVSRQVTENEHVYTLFEWEGYYKFGRHQKSPAFSYLNWNEQRVRIVAIDGQHRLSALKRWKNEPPDSSKQLATWTIPVVVLGIFKAAPNKPTASFLEIVRKTFVYINSTAQSINEARETLLNDESVVKLCTQELIQDSHSNDCLPINERDEAKLPLLLFDWRGETRNNVRISAPAALKTVEEVRDWLGWYVLGDDGSDDQATVLGLEDLVPPLATFGPDKKLSHDDALRIREQFRATVLPGLQFCLQNFTPYKDYIRECRRVEREALDQSDLAQHSLMRLRFGTTRASEDIMELVNRKFEDLVLQFESLKGKIFDELLLRDVGMRAVIAAFGWGKHTWDDDREETGSWEAYAEWFTPLLNSIYSDGWFRSFMKQDTTRRGLLKHVVFDPSGAIVNYKFEQVSSGFGALLTLLVFSKGRSSIQVTTAEKVWEEWSEALRGPLRSGYRREHRADLNENFKGTQAQLRDEIKKRAEADVEKHVGKLKVFLGG
jgi:hypothetical protein